MSALTLTVWPLVNLILTAVLILGGTLRLTRLVTTDDLGQWLLRDPLSRWAVRKENARRRAMREVIDRMNAEEGEIEEGAVLLLQRWQAQLDDLESWVTWQGRIVSGLWCPFCVGFWIGLIVLAVTVLVAPLAVWITVVWTLILAALTLNYAAGHLSAKID